MVDVSSHDRFRRGNLMHLGIPDQALPSYGRINIPPYQLPQCYRTPILSKQFCLPPVHCGLWSITLCSHKCLSSVSPSKRERLITAMYLWDRDRLSYPWGYLVVQGDVTSAAEPSNNYSLVLQES